MAVALTLLSLLLTAFLGRQTGAFINNDRWGLGHHVVTPTLHAHKDEYQDALARNRKRTDVRLFLTQRAIQSFINLLMETRDPHTVKWIDVRAELVAATV